MLKAAEFYGVEYVAEIKVMLAFQGFVGLKYVEDAVVT